MRSWSTQDEINFLTRIGTFTPKTDRRQALLGYIEAWPKRKEWNWIDKDAALAHATTQLMRIV